MRQLGFWLVLLFVVACQSTSERAPDKLLSEDKMVALLTRIHAAESRVFNVQSGVDDSTRFWFEYYKTSIFKDEGIEDSVFTQSMSYYSRNPKLLQVIYQRVIDSLGKRESLAGQKNGFKP